MPQEQMSWGNPIQSPPKSPPVAPNGPAGGKRHKWALVAAAVVGGLGLYVMSGGKSARGESPLPDVRVPDVKPVVVKSEAAPVVKSDDKPSAANTGRRNNNWNVGDNNNVHVGDNHYHTTTIVVHPAAAATTAPPTTVVVPPATVNVGDGATSVKVKDSCEPGRREHESRVAAWKNELGAK